MTTKDNIIYIGPSYFADATVVSDLLTETETIKY